MLNLTEKNKANHASLGQFSTIKNLENRPHYKVLNRIIVIFSIIVLLFLFLPWTQNISGSGSVTTLKPDQRPQTIHTAIAGRIEKWYVKEGDAVTQGEEFGFIKFGSRVDIFLPLDAKILVKLDDKPVSGETVIAELA